MRLLGPLLRRTFVALVLSNAVAWWMAANVFPLAPEQLDGLRLVFLVGVVLEWAAVSLVVAQLAAPIRRAGDLPAPLAEPEERAAAGAAHRGLDRDLVVLIVDVEGVGVELERPAEGLLQADLEVVDEFRRGLRVRADVAGVQAEGLIAAVVAAIDQGVVVGRPLGPDRAGPGRR
jgi:hypothetical protein